MDQPFVSPDRWTQELLCAGFSEPEAIVLDDSAPYHVNAGIIVPRESRTTSLSRVSLLCHDRNGPYVSEVQSCLAALNVAVDVCHFGEALNPQNDIVSLLDVQDPVLHGMSEETFKIVKGYLSSHKAAILWITQASQVGDVKDPRAAIVLGLARTARNELSLPFLTVEVDEMTTSASAAASAITKILHRARWELLEGHESMDPDYEYAVVKGEILIPRLHWQTISEASQLTQPGDKNETEDVTSHWRITMKMPGLLHTMAWSKGASSNTPMEGEVIVETKAVGLNFRVRIIDPRPSSSGHVCQLHAK